MSEQLDLEMTPLLPTPSPHFPRGHVVRKKNRLGGLIHRRSFLYVSVDRC